MHPMTGSITVPRVPLRLIVVAAAHVGLFYLVTDALRFELKRDVDRHTDVTFVDKKDPRPVVEELNPEPRRETITVDPPAPPVPIDFEERVDLESDTLTLHIRRVDEHFEAPPVRFVPVGAHPDHPLTRAEYPAASIRLEEEGVVELSIYVSRNGRIGEVRVARSSGYPRLDRAAMEEARRRWRLQPAMRGDEAIDAWGSFRVVFRLDGR
jgi:periplasmic protein TonB